MKSKMRNCLFVPLLLCCLPVMAQIEFKSLQDVLDYADTRAISIQSAVINEQIANSEKKEATSKLLPYFNASFGYNDNITLQPTLVPAQLVNPTAPEGTFEELAFGTKYTYSGSFQAQWDILNFQKIFALQTADLKVEVSKVNTELNRFNTYNQLASTYYSVLLTKESIKLYKENLETASAILNHAEDKYQKGIISAAELNQAKIKRLQNQKSLSLALDNLDQFYIQLQSQLNTRERISVEDKLEQFILTDTSIPYTHPEVLGKELEVQQSEASLSQVKSARMPSLSLFYQNNQLWATDEFMGFSEASRLPQQIFGLKLDLSGLLSVTTKQKINQSKIQLELQQLQLANTRLVKEQEDDLLQLQLKQAVKQLAETKEILALQEENDLHSENKYQAGIMSLDQRLDKYNDLLAVQDSYLQSLATFTLAQYKIYIRQINFQSK